MTEIQDLFVEREGEITRLLSPAVGEFTCALPAGQLLGPGQAAGVLSITARPVHLRVPPGVSGRITNPRPERVHAPVSYSQVLYVLAPVEAGEDAAEEAGAAAQEGLVLRAPQTGRFYHRPAPDEEAFVSAGDEVGEGDALGLIEVMKTFAHVHYRPGGGLPTRALVRRYLAEDGADVRQGEGLVEFED